MKKIKIYIIALTAILTLPVMQSCSDYLDKEPDTELTTEMVFENRDKVYSWLSYVYNIIHNPDKWALTADGYEVFADDITPSARWQQWDWGGVIPKILGQWTINSTWGGNLWHMMPRYIRHGYIFNNMVKAMPDHDLPQSEINNMKNEVKFLCAYAWWQMAENYGGIPFTPDYIAPTDFELSDLMVGQSKFDDVVDYCDKQMLEAAMALPAVYDDPAKYGRINRIMALTVRARMLLFAASPLVNGNPWYTDYVNDKNEQIFNSVYDPQKWVKAEQACKLCIDEAENAGYALYTEPGPNGGIDPFLSTYNVHIKRWSEGNHEITFPVTKGNSIDIPNMIRTCPSVLKIVRNLRFISVCNHFRKSSLPVLRRIFSRLTRSDSRQTMSTRSSYCMTVSPFGMISSCPLWIAAIRTPAGRSIFFRGLSTIFMR